MLLRVVHAKRVSNLVAPCVLLTLLVTLQRRRLLALQGKQTAEDSKLAVSNLLCKAWWRRLLPQKPAISKATRGDEEQKPHHQH
jgi:hypothetical protein